jgi:predicted tellurium resistance membrane protein TerC
MEWFSDPSAWIALLTLTVLEIVLGIDNIIFISILSGKLPEDQQKKGRTIGLFLAMGTRILLLLSLSWIMKLTSPLFNLLGQEISGRDLILIIGGLFLLGKSTTEIHNKLEGEEHDTERKAASFMSVIIQIALLDIVFSLDSVITAIGMADQVSIMILAVIIAVGFMLVFASSISNFVHKHPTIKMLALAFLLLIGVTLVAEGFEQHISKGYIYFAMAFSVLVEMLNLKMRASAKKKKDKPVELRMPHYGTGVEKQ